MTASDIEKFRGAIRTFEQLRADQLRHSTQCIGVSGARCHTLLALDEHMPCSFTTLAEMLCLEKSTVSRTVDSLVRAGMVNRVDNPENRRESQLSLTPEGIAMVGNINTENNRIFGQILSGMSPADAKKLLHSFTAFTEAFHRQLYKMKETGNGTNAVPRRKVIMKGKR